MMACISDGTLLDLKDLDDLDSDEIVFRTSLLNLYACIYFIIILPTGL
jgi:hypothetical protein